MYTSELRRNDRVKEHKDNCRLGHTDNSTLAAHLLNNDHKIIFENIQLLLSCSTYYLRIYREASEIYKHRNNLNRSEETMKINYAWVSKYRTRRRKLRQCIGLLLL